MSDQRDGLDRRDSADTAITLGEVFRLCERIEARMTALSDGIDKDVHSLRGRINVMHVAVSLLELKVDVLECKGRDWRGWIAAGLIGGLLALLPYVIQAMAR